MIAHNARNGGEIFHRSSLDHSLGQARNNIYLAGKCWASYLALERIFSSLSESDAASERLLQVQVPIH